MQRRLEELTSRLFAAHPAKANACFDVSGHEILHVRGDFFDTLRLTIASKARLTMPDSPHKRFHARTESDDAITCAGHSRLDLTQVCARFDELHQDHVVRAGRLEVGPYCCGERR